MAKKNFRNGSAKPTLRDIAELANVSPTTVSLVIRNNMTTRVGEATRKKILDLAAQLEYRPNYVARSLARKESRTLGLVITTLQNPFYSEIAQDIISRAEEIGFSVLASSVRGGIEDERRSINELLLRGVDGLIICSCLRDDPVISDLIEDGAPFVLAMRNIARRLGAPPVDFIGVDNNRGAYIGLDHLVRMGHSDVAIIAGSQDTSTGYDRLAGALAALEAHGVPKKSELIQIGDFHRLSGYSLTKKMIDARTAFTALFCHNDYMAMGALEALREKGRKVPNDVAVVGFDDIEATALPGIDLTTISQKKETMGRLAVDTLIEKLEGDSADIIKSIVLEPLLVVRNSCGFKARGGVYKLPELKG